MPERTSWQCHICGTVYAWWVAACRQNHEPRPVSATGANGWPCTGGGDCPCPGLHG